MQRSKILVMGLATLTLIFWGGLSWMAVAAQADASMEGANAPMQGVDSAMQGGNLQGVSYDSPLGSSAAGQDAALTNNQPLPFAVPAAQTSGVVQYIPPGQGKIQPYDPNQPQPVAAAAARNTTEQPSTLYAIWDPQKLKGLLPQQPKIMAKLNQSQALQITDSTGLSYPVTSGQLLDFLPLLADRRLGFSGTLDLGGLSAQQQKTLVDSGSIKPVAPPSKDQPNANQSVGGSSSTTPNGTSAPSDSSFLEGGSSGQTANQSASPAGGRAQQAQGPNSASS
jgi:hypothetical protein